MMHVVLRDWLELRHTFALRKDGTATRELLAVSQNLKVISNTARRLASPDVPHTVLFTTTLHAFLVCANVADAGIVDEEVVSVLVFRSLNK